MLKNATLPRWSKGGLCCDFLQTVYAAGEKEQYKKRLKPFSHNCYSYLI